VPQNNVLTRRSGFQPGVSGNPGGRPHGLARAARAAVGDDGERIIGFWISVMDDEDASTRDRLEASRLLADRGWGKVTTQAPLYAAQTETAQPEVDRRPTRERMLALLKLAQELEAPDVGEVTRNGHLLAAG
jgi:hypothetical protein